MAKNSLAQYVDCEPGQSGFFSTILGPAIFEEWVAARVPFFPAWLVNWLNCHYKAMLHSI